MSDGDLTEDLSYMFTLAAIEASADGTFTLRAPKESGRTMLGVSRERMLEIVAAKWGGDPTGAETERVAAIRVQNERASRAWTKRAPVQRDCSSPHPGRYGCTHTAESREHQYGTVTWAEHERAWEHYAKRYGRDQSAERLAERGGFGYAEITEHLGHAPTTWEPRA